MDESYKSDLSKSSLNDLKILIDKQPFQQSDSLYLLDLEICNSLYIKSLKNQKYNDEQVTKEVIEYIKMININHRLYFTFLLYLINEKSPTKYIVQIIESTFFNTEDHFNNFGKIISDIYLGSSNDLINYNIPIVNKFISIIFKLPDIVSNILERNFINQDDYYEKLIKLLLEENIFFKDILTNFVIEKLVLLKLLCIFVKVLIKIKSKSLMIESIEKFEKSLYLPELLNEFLRLNLSTKEDQENLIFCLNTLEIINFEDFVKTSKFINLLQNNQNVIVIILELFKTKVEIRGCILNKLKEIFSNKKWCLDCNQFQFLLLNFTIYKLLNDEEQIDFLQKIFQTIIINFEINDPIKKKISLAICNKLKNILIKTNVLDEKEIFKINFTSDLFKNEKEKEFFDFEEINKKYLKSSFCFIDDLRKEFNSEILGINEDSEEIKVICENSNKQNSTTYKSVKFQKKYNKFEAKNKRDKDIIFPTVSQTNNVVFEKFESKLKINLIQDDDFRDLKSLNKTVYLKDLLLGFRSESKERFKQAMDTCEDLIKREPEDLDMNCEELSEILLKIDDKFDLEKFEENINKSLVALTIVLPEKMSIILSKRFFSEECGLKQKFEILKVLENSIESISNYKIKTSTINPLNKLNENFITPLLDFISVKKLNFLVTIKDFYFLLAKFIIVISKIIKFSSNSPNIYKILIESFKIFKALYQNDDTIIIDSLNFYCNVALKFLNQTFLEIYPEFFKNFKIIFEWLEKRYSELNNEDLKIEILKNLNFYCQSISKLNENINDKNLIIL